MELPLTAPAMRPVEGWADDRGVRLHFLHTLPGEQGKTPLVIVPGFSESAEYWFRVMTSLAPRGCVSMSLRGRGKSDAPEAGYAFENHVDDIQTVIDSLDLKRFCLMGFSRGVTYGLGYASRHLERVRGLILIDFPARYHLFPPSYIEEFLSTPLGGKLGSELLQPRVAWALQREGLDVSLWDVLSRVEVPVLFMHGGQPESLIASSAVEKYRQVIRNGRVVKFEDSGHDLREPDYERFVNTVEGFLTNIDRPREN